MREILFRGKTILEGEWVYGFLFITRKGKYNIKWYDPHFGSSNTSEVYPESVGQFTGFKDMHGNKIFEGDIIYARHTNDGSLTKGTVNFLNGCFCVQYNNYNNPAMDLLKEYVIAKE